MYINFYPFYFYLFPLSFSRTFEFGMITTLERVALELMFGTTIYFTCKYKVTLLLRID